MTTNTDTTTTTTNDKPKPDAMHTATLAAFKRHTAEFRSDVSDATSALADLEATTLATLAERHRALGVYLNESIVPNIIKDANGKALTNRDRDAMGGDAIRKCFNSTTSGVYVASKDDRDTLPSASEISRARAMATVTAKELSDLVEFYVGTGMSLSFSSSFVPWLVLATTGKPGSNKSNVDTAATMAKDNVAKVGKFKAPHSVVRKPATPGKGSKPTSVKVPRWGAFETMSPDVLSTTYAETHVDLSEHDVETLERIATAAVARLLILKAEQSADDKRSDELYVSVG